MVTKFRIKDLEGLMSRVRIICFVLFSLPIFGFPEVRKTIEVPLFEGGAGLDFYESAASAYESLRQDIKVDHQKRKNIRKKK